MVHILLNGDRRELPGPLSVRALLDLLSIDGRVVAVELNRTVIRRHDHETAMVTDGAEVEIVSFVGGGAMRARRRRSWLALVLVLVVAGSVASGRATLHSQAQTPPAQKPVLTDETLVVYNGWAMLAAGDTDKAVSYAQAILAKYPSSIAGASLLVEAEIVRGGGAAGLAAYERWLRGRRLDDGYLLRRAARASLWDAASSPEVGVEALQSLAADADPEAYARLAQKMAEGSAGDTRALARVGDEGAIRRLIDQVDKLPGNKLFQIKTLIESRSPLAIPPLTNLLNDRLHPDHMAAAAEGLGILGAKATIPALRRLYQDQTTTLAVRNMAAVGLYQMNDMTGLPLLEKQLASPEPYIKVDAARRMVPPPGSGPPDPSWLKIVRELAANPDPVIRVQAAPLLAPYDLEAARRTLDPLLIDANEAVRELAAKSLIEGVATDFATLRSLMRSTSALTRVRAADRVLRLTR